MRKFFKAGIAQAKGRIGKILLFCLVGTLLTGSVNLILSLISSGQIQKAMLNFDYLSIIITTLIITLIQVPFSAIMGGVLADFYETAKNDYENKITA